VPIEQLTVDEVATIAAAVFIACVKAYEKWLEQKPPIAHCPTCGGPTERHMP
jgi:rRNA maturation endonuclease Nob1